MERKIYPVIEQKSLRFFNISINKHSNFFLINP
nr:MAG TPA: hypothetical protein [Caudoviricetes sp.]